METTGLDAALGLAEVQDRLENTVKGWVEPTEYFALFRNSLQVDHESHTWFRDRVVTSYDDHDQVRKGSNKARFAADPEGRALAAAALATNVTTLGIPCIYYGSEQCFDGRGGRRVR
jgi:glycosidase